MLACDEEPSTTVFPIYESRSTERNITSRQDILPDFNPGGYIPLDPAIPQVPYPPQMMPSYPGGCSCCNSPPQPPPIFPQVPQYPILPFPPQYPQYPSQPYPPIGFPPCGPPSCNGGGGNGGFQPSYPGYLPVKEPEKTVEANKTVSSPQFAPYPGFPPIGGGGFPPQGFPGGLQQCCRNIFRNRRFYLTSPNFPLNNRYPSDCLYVIERWSPQICRLRIGFRFFNHGDCISDFLEIDGQRICGCRSGQVFVTQWAYGPKIIRYRNSGFGRGNGFVLDIIQENCPYRLESGAVAEKRMDILQVQTNSTSTSTYYSPQERQQQQQNEIFEEKEPNERFLGASGQCTLNTLEWLLLKKSALFIGSPICYRY